MSNDTTGDLLADIIGAINDVTDFLTDKLEGLENGTHGLDITETEAAAAIGALRASISLYNEAVGTVLLRALPQ